MLGEHDGEDKLSLSKLFYEFYHIKSPSKFLNPMVGHEIPTFNPLLQTKAHTLSKAKVIAHAGLEELPISELIHEEAHYSLGV